MTLLPSVHEPLISGLRTLTYRRGKDSPERGPEGFRGRVVVTGGCVARAQPVGGPSPNSDDDARPIITPEN